jgi:hypothetical protein
MIRVFVTIKRGLDWWPDLLHTYTTCYYTSQTTIIHYVFSSLSSSTGASLSVYSFGTAPTENTASQECFYCYKGVFTSPLHRNISYFIVACLFMFTGSCLPSRCLEINVYSGCAIQAFRRHVTVCSFQCQDDCDELKMWKDAIIPILSIMSTFITLSRIRGLRDL